MNDRIDDDPAAYATRLAAEDRYYRDDVEVHDLPGIFHYWSNRHIRPKLEAFGFRNPKEMFRKYIGEQCLRRKNAPQRFVSIGSGNCDLEIELALDLRAHGYTDFAIDCLDLNAAMLDRGRASATSHEVAAHLNFVQTDFNAWTPQHEYDAVMANQALHHVLQLEDLFTRIKSSLKPDGRFIVSDMVGRNGHQRWPEALDIVREFWRKLPPSYRFNHALERYEEMYENWDCSRQGFEAIRSQDILPLLLQNFHFQVFIAFANVIEPFVDRGFGYNFDTQSSWDCDFIDVVHQRDEAEFVSGRLKPTHILAVLGSVPSSPMLFHEPLTPEFCVRTASSVTVASGFAGENPYEWHSWPHSPRTELEIACRRLKEAEDRINEQSLKLTADLAERTAWARKLEEDFAERTGWALLLEQEVADRTRRALDLQRELERLNTELEKRTAWALQLNQELQQLNQQFEQRTAWALKLDQELESLNQQFEQRTAWALELNRDLQERTAQTLQLTTALEKLAWARVLDRRFHAPLHAAFRMVQWIRTRIKASPR